MAFRTPTVTGLAVSPDAAGDANNPAASSEEMEGHVWWGRWSLAALLPNASSNLATGAAYAALRPGDQAYVQGDELPYVLQDRGTLGGGDAVWASAGEGGAVVAGGYYNAALFSPATATVGSVADRVEVVPFRSTQRLEIDRLGFSVTAGVALALGRAGIYSGTPWPDVRLAVTADLDCSGAAFVESAVAFTFLPGQRYWLALHTSAATTQRALALTVALNLGLSGADATSFYTKLRRSVAFAGGLPASWVFDPSELVAGSPPDVRFRAA